MKLICLVTVLVFSLLFVFSVKAQIQDKSNNTSEQEINKDTVDGVFKILKISAPQGTLSCRKGLYIVKLDVTFHYSGKVTDVKIKEESGCGAFDKNALKAAKKIKFRQETQNGKDITLIKTVQYSFRMEDEF